MKNILLINGPNLNLLGKREPSIYGNKNLDQIEQELVSNAQKANCSLECFQSNSESEIVDFIQNMATSTDVIIINPGAFTHTSIAIRDTLLAVSVPFIEVHISNIFSREEFRKQSYFSDIAIGIISGLGFESYNLALDAAIKLINNQS